MLIRLDPFREPNPLTEQLASTATRAPRAFPIDAYRRGDQFIVEFDLPGVKPASIDLTVENNVLSVRSERRFEPREGDEVLVAERPHGTYTRQLFLADTLDSQNVQANYEHGVLTLTIPVAQAAKPRRVQIGGGQDDQTIEPPTAGGAQATPAGQPARPPDRRRRAARAELPALTRPVGIGRPAVASEEEGLDISETGMYGYPRAVHARRRRPRALRWSPATPQRRRRQDELRDG
jgi:HSP20 family protein